MDLPRSSASLLAIALSTSVARSAEGQLTPLIELLEHGSITLEPMGLGGHSGECLRVNVHNTSSRAFRTCIPPGWTFTSVEPETQDLIVVREEVLALGPGARKTVTCRAFCCESGGSSPDEGEAYRKGHPASEKLITLASLIANNDYPDHLVQSAVWVLSDDNDIASVGALDSTELDTLRYLLSRLSGQPPPRYSMFYAEDSLRACSGRPERILRTLDLDLAVPSEVTIVVRNDQGLLFTVLMDHEGLPPGHHSLPLEVNVLEWPQGRYTFHAYSSDRAGAHRMPFTL